MNVAVIVPAAGRGTRMVGLDRPKQLVEIGGKPVFVWAIEPFQQAPSIAAIVVVAAPEDRNGVDNLLRTHGLTKVRRVVEGGTRRQDSVWAGIQELRRAVRPEFVLIHDAARPFIDTAIIDSILNALRADDAAIVAVPVRDTLKIAEGDRFVHSTLQREGVWMAQTPQGFRFDLLLRAHERAIADGFEGTDDASLVERIGVRIRIVEGRSDNLKITATDDLALAELLVRRRTVRR